jgi:hypothetical protein
LRWFLLLLFFAVTITSILGCGNAKIDEQPDHPGFVGYVIKNEDSRSNFNRIETSQTEDVVGLLKLII